MLHHARLLSLAGSDLYSSVRFVLSHTQPRLTCPPGLVLLILLLEVVHALVLLTAQATDLRVVVNLRITHQTPTEEVTGIHTSGIGHGSITRETELLMTMDDVGGAVVLRLATMVRYLRRSVLCVYSNMGWLFVVGRKRRRSASPYDRERYDPRPRYDEYGMLQVSFC